MTLKELLKDKFKDGMTPEEIEKALEGIEAPQPEPTPAPGGEVNPMQSYETEKLKAAVTRGCLQTQAIQTRMAASRVTAKNRQARFSYLVAKRR